MTPVYQPSAIETLGAVALWLLFLIAVSWAAITLVKGTASLATRSDRGFLLTFVAVCSGGIVLALRHFMVDWITTCGAVFGACLIAVMLWPLADALRRRGGK